MMMCPVHQGFPWGIGLLMVLVDRGTRLPTTT
jgi:hypothetical protein